MKKIIALIVSCSTVLAAVGCETLTVRQSFGQLAVGMEKGEVAEMIGNPIRRDRKYEKDWWYYQIVDGDKILDRMVVFKDGRLVYAGRVTVPNFVKEADKVDQDHDIGDKGLQTNPAPLVDESQPSLPAAVEPSGAAEGH